MRVFVGTAPNHEDAESQAVLEYTLRKHSSEPLEITWMKLSRDPESPFYSNPEKGEGWNTSQWATPFSGFRWAIPELCGFKGKAIYTDSDVMFMADPAELWKQEFAVTKAVMTKEASTSRFCVSLWDCERMQKHAVPIKALKVDPASHKGMSRLFGKNPWLVQAFKGNWNCLDGEHYDDLNDKEIKAIHYTSMKHQPQLRFAVPRLAKEGRKHWFDGEPAEHWRPDIMELFDRLYSEASEAGYGVDRYTQDPVFGDIEKMSVRNQGKTIPKWGRKVA